jgi:hypothetical protein
MTPVFKKMNFKGQSPIHVVDAPPSFMPELEAMSAYTEVRFKIGASDQLQFAITFVTSLQQIEQAVKGQFPQLAPEAAWWFAYPKGSSKKYQCEFNRDTGWASLGQLGYEGVRIVSIDEDWTALRFRAVQEIKTFTRRSTMALSEQGKERGKK